MRRKVKSAFLACILAAAMVIGTAPSMVYAEEAAGEETAEAYTTGEDATEESTEATTEAEAQETEDLATADGVTGYYLTYGGHVQTYGDMDPVYDGAYFGTTGESKRLESIFVQKGNIVEGLNGDIVYRTHVQTYGNTEWKKNGESAGTRGEGKRLEAVQMYLTGDMAEFFDIYYCLHVQTFGWSKWVKGTSEDSGWCGTSGFAKRVEAMRVKLVPKGEAAPEDMSEAKVNYTYLTPNSDFGLITYSGHQQTYGDIGPVLAGGILGVTGQSKRLEGLRIGLDSDFCSGSISYQAHVQTYGWQNWVSDGALAGTTGQAKRVEAIKIQLQGDIANYCDVYYRVHAQSYGWMGWAKNGQAAGTTALGKRIEAIEIRLVPKGGLTPEETLNPYATYVP